MVKIYVTVCTCALVHFMCIAILRPFTDSSLNPQCRLMYCVHFMCFCSCYFSYFTSTLPSLHHHSFHGNDFFHLYSIKQDVSDFIRANTLDDFFLAKNMIVAEWDYVAPKGGSRGSINNSLNLYCIMVEDVRVC